MDLFGLLLDHADKFVPVGISNTFLGVVSDLAGFGAGAVHLCATEKRVRKVTALLVQVVESGILSPGDASTIRGKLYFTCCSAFGRAGVAILRAFSERQYSSSDSYELTEELLEAINFFLLFLPRLAGMSRRVAFTSYGKRALLIWSDAMWDSDKRSGSIGFVVYDREYNI